MDKLLSIVNYYNRPEGWIETSWFKDRVTFTTAYLTARQYSIDYANNCIRLIDFEKDEYDPKVFYCHTVVYVLREVNKIVAISYHLQQRDVLSPIVYTMCQRGIILTPENYRSILRKNRRK